LLTPLFALFLGACVGSFLNVCLFRWKSGGQVFTPSSFCPHCRKTIAWFDNIPIISFALLQGKCRFCGKSISFQYPLVEVGTAFLFWSASTLAPNRDPEIVISGYFFISFLVLLVVSDLKWRLLPHVFNNFFIFTGLILSMRFSFSAMSLFLASSDSIIVGSFMFGLIQFFPKVMGGGDIKMITGLTIWLGFYKVVCVIFIAFSLGALLALVLMMKNKITRKSMMPFGPFLAFAALVIWLFPEFFEQIRVSL
jgi:leader peptidase (prepilin peptidase) / N-methyltransferase